VDRSYIKEYSPEELAAFEEHNQTAYVKRNTPKWFEKKRTSAFKL
jgi:hypothetical protein